MADIQSVQSQQVQPSVLSREDIMRMPKSYGMPANGLQADTYESQQESHTGRNFLLTAIGIALAIVGLKHLPFMKVEEGATGFLANWIKKPIATVGGWIELPFVKLAGIFKKTDNKLPSEPPALPAPTPSTPAPTPKKGIVRRFFSSCGDKIHSFASSVKNIFTKKKTA